MPRIDTPIRKPIHVVGNHVAFMLRAAYPRLQGAVVLFVEGSQVICCEDLLNTELSQAPRRSIARHASRTH